MNSIVIPNKQDVIDARALIEPYIHNTPVLSSSSINEIYGVELYLKCENFQKMGAFKMRGAAHAILKLSNEEREKGVTTHSSGNFAQALSLAAKCLGVKATIVITGAMKPERFSNSDAPINIGAAIAACQTLNKGCYIVMHGMVIPHDQVERDLQTGKYYINE